MPNLELLNIIVCSALVGFIWLVQLSYYPSFRFVEVRQWKEFHEHHTKSISVIAMPLMIAELALASYFFWISKNAIAATCLGLTGVAWLSTFLQAVPIHSRIRQSHDRKQIDKLVKINWIRTFAWSIKLAILAFTVRF